MTLQEAHDCLTRRWSTGCKGCKYHETAQSCLETAQQIGATAINYMMVGEKLKAEAER